MGNVSAHPAKIATAMKLIANMALDRNRLVLPFLDQLDDITNIPKVQL